MHLHQKHRSLTYGYDGKIWSLKDSSLLKRFWNVLKKHQQDLTPPSSAQIRVREMCLQRYMRTCSTIIMGIMADNTMERQIPFYLQRLTEIRACVSNYFHCIVWGVIAHPCPKLNDGVTRPLKAGRGWVITSYCGCRAPSQYKDRLSQVLGSPC